MTLRKHMIMGIMLATILTLSGCGSSSSSKTNTQESRTQASQEQSAPKQASASDAETSVSQASEQAAESTEADEVAKSDEAAEQTDEQANEQTADAKYIVSIDAARLSADYSGEPCVIITYTFTNNSDEAESFMLAVNADVYQNGVECDTALGSEADSSTLMNKVKPGSSIQVEAAYSIKDNSDIEVEVSELFSFNKEKLATATFSLS